MNTCDYCGGVLIEIDGELICLHCDEINDLEEVGAI